MTEKKQVALEALQQALASGDAAAIEEASRTMVGHLKPEASSS